MKKLVVLFAIFVSLTLVGCADELDILSIDVEVELLRDGSAIVTETWDVVNISEGTEFYRVLNLPETMSVHSLEVTDQTDQPFRVVHDWDISASFEEKAYLAGIIPVQAGYEIAWGMTRRGDNRYTVRYVLDGLVQGLLDGAGFYHYFVSDGMSPAPRATSILLWQEGVHFSAENAYVQLFGVNGEPFFTEDGAIFVQGDLSGDGFNGVRMATRFQESSFEIAMRQDVYFEEIVNEVDGFVTFLWIVGVIGGAFLVIGGIVGFFMGRIRLADGTVEKRPAFKNIPLRYDFPFNGSFPATFYALKELPSGVYFESSFESSVFSVYVMKLQSVGALDIGKVGKKNVVIQLKTPEASLASVEQTLYNLLLKSADQNGRLSTVQSSKWQKLGKRVTAWENRVRKMGEKELLSLGLLAVDKKGTPRFTTSGYRTLLDFWGYIKYLKEFSKALGTGELDDKLRQDDLLFATLIGLRRDLKKYFDKNMNQIDDGFLPMWQLMWLTGTFNQSLIHTDSYSGSSVGGGFSGGATGGGGGGAR